MTADRHDPATTTRPGAGRADRVRGARRVMIVAVVGSLVVASVLGIVALLSGEFGDMAGRIVLTTLVVAAFGTTALCHLAVVTRAVRVVGYAGLAGSVGAAACALVLVWWDSEGATGPQERLLEALLLLTIVAVSLAHANLLLLLAARPHPVIRAGLVATLVAIGVVAVMLAIPVLTELPGLDDGWYWRWLGVAGIVDALGTIALPVLGLVLRPARTDPAAAEPSGTVRLVLDLPPDLAARLDAHAGGGPWEDAARDVLHRGLR